MKRFLYLTFATLLLVFGILQLAIALFFASTALHATTWSTIDGSIVQAAVSVSSGGRTSHRPTVVYSYQVGSAKYENDNIWVVDFSTTLADARKLVDAYPRGMGVRVYVDPENPERSILRPGLSWYSYFSVALSSLAVAVGTYLLRRGRLPPDSHAA